MLYFFRDKIYVKPFDSKIVEVTVTKDENGYDVKALKAPLELTSSQLKELSSITLEDAYKYQNKGNKTLSEKKSERKKDLF